MFFDNFGCLISMVSSQSASSLRCYDHVFIHAFVDNFWVSNVDGTKPKYLINSFLAVPKNAVFVIRFTYNPLATNQSSYIRLMSPATQLTTKSSK